MARHISSFLLVTEGMFKLSQPSQSTDLCARSFSAVPQAAEFFDAQPLAKGKTEKTKKKKEGKNAQVADTGFMTVPAPQMHSIPISNGNSPIPSGLASGISSGSPAPKPGFSRISSAVDSPALDGSSAGERSKVAFGFGTKRKAGEEAQGSPPAKRR